MQRVTLDNRKAIEAAAILTASSPNHRINRKRLLALLYIANRECLEQAGRPLIGGRVAALRHGPIHADVYDLIKEREGTEGLAEWSKHFHNETYFVVLDKDPGINALSRFEARVLAQTAKKYENIADFDVARLTHRFSEYGTTYRKGKARTIPIEALVYAVTPGPLVSSVLRDLRDKQVIDEMFGGAEGTTDKTDD
jgi:uncharacterized phage-associated protein